MRLEVDAGRGEIIMYIMYEEEGPPSGLASFLIKNQEGRVVAASQGVFEPPDPPDHPEWVAWPSATGDFLPGKYTVTASCGGDQKTLDFSIN